MVSEVLFGINASVRDEETYNFYYDVDASIGNTPPLDEETYNFYYDVDWAVTFLSLSMKKPIISTMM